MKLKKELQEIAGGAYKDALFYRFRGGLRFTLSEGGSQRDMALKRLR